MGKNKNKIFKFLIGLIILILICLVALIFFNNFFKVKADVLETVSLVKKQSLYEEKFVSSGYTLDNPNVILNPYHISPLTALVIFETEDEVSVSVTIVGKDDNSTLTHDFEKAKIHYLSIYGLYADSDNKVIIKVGDITKLVNITTKKLPEKFILPTNVDAKKEKLDNDFYFFSPASKGMYPSAYDVNGDVRWYFTEMLSWDNTYLENGRLLLGTERLINSPYYSTGFYEMDMLGKIYNEYKLPGGYHHDYFELPSGNFLVASNDFYNSSGTVEDYIVELDRGTGNIVKTFDLKDILNMEDGASEGWSSTDWFHNNSVWFDEKTNSIMLSGRHKDAIVNIDYETGELNWIIGDDTNWDEEYQKYFFEPLGDDFEWQWSQHAAMVLPNGNIFVLDNGNNKSKIEEDYVSAENSYTRGVIYQIDTDNMTIKQVWEYGKDRGSDFYSPYISDVDYFAEGHYLIHSGGISYKDGVIMNYPAGFTGADTLKSETVEIKDDEVIFDLVMPTNIYRAEKMNIYSEAKFELGAANILGNFDVTNVSKTEYNLLFNKSIVPDKYDLDLTKEYDRFVLKGTFIPGDDVELILYKDFKLFYYDILITRTPYAALCIDVYTAEEKENGVVINKYINDINMTGEYIVYLKINDIIYSTNQKLKF